MICDEYLSAIDPYLDGELPVIDVVRMHRHLVGCERCRRVMNSEAALHALLSAEETQDQPAHPFETKSCSESPPKMTGSPTSARDGGDLPCCLPY